MKDWSNILSLLAVVSSIMALVSATLFVVRDDYWHLVWTVLYFVYAFVLDKVAREWRKR